MGHVIGDDTSSVVERERHLDADALAFEGLVPAFNLAVALGIVRRGSDMAHTGDADELLEVLGDELRSVVGDDAWLLAGNFSRALWMMVCTSISSIFSRISQWTMKRL